MQPLASNSQAPATGPASYCRKCGYFLHALSLPRCPECGRPFDPSNPRTTRNRPPRRWPRHLRRAAVAFLALFLPLAAFWGWLYWDWHSEQQALIELRMPRSVVRSPLYSPWLRAHASHAGFVLDRTIYLRLENETTNLTPLARLTELQTLEFVVMDNPGAVSDLSPLAELSKLEKLVIRGTGVNDVSALSRLSNLK